MGKDLEMGRQRKLFWRECCFSLDEKACVDEVWMNWGIVLSTRNTHERSSLDIYVCISNALHCWWHTISA